MSRPICLFVSRERKDNCFARSWLIINSGGMRLCRKRSICLICAAPNPAVFPKILLIAVFPVRMRLACNLQVMTSPSPFGGQVISKRIIN
jgi:hypothetical protein